MSSDDHSEPLRPLTLLERCTAHRHGGREDGEKEGRLATTRQVATPDRLNRSIYNPECSINVRVQVLKKVTAMHTDINLGT